MEEVTAWQKLSDIYEVIFIHSDPRVNQWFLLTSHWPPLLIVTTYFLIVYYGPKYMEKRQSFQLKNVLLAYNAMQVCMSFYMFQEGLRTALGGQINLICESFEHRDDPVTMKLFSIGWLFYMSKVIDLLDTVFFIMKKNFNQVTFLHVFHHSTMVTNSWIGIRHVVGGAVLIPCLINAFIHTIMYSYYFLAAMGPEIQKHLWWKKYITQLQLAQFVVVIVHVAANLYNQCPGPKWLLTYGVLYVISILILFMNYYIQTHIKNKISKSAKSEKSASKNSPQQEITKLNKLTSEVKSKSL